MAKIYITIGIKEPRLKRGYTMSAISRAKKVHDAQRTWQEKGNEIVRKQIERKHPWRTSFFFTKKPSPGYSI